MLCARYSLRDKECWLLSLSACWELDLNMPNASYFLILNSTASSLYTRATHLPPAHSAAVARLVLALVVYLYLSDVPIASVRGRRSTDRGRCCEVSDLAALPQPMCQSMRSLISHGYKEALTRCAWLPTGRAALGHSPSDGPSYEAEGPRSHHHAGYPP